MKTKLDKLIIIPAWVCLYILLTIFSGCSHNPVKTNLFTGFQEIEKGEAATLQWDFEYADRVKISNIDATFEPSDSLTVYPNSTTKYVVTAYQGNVDSLQMTARVIVIDSEPDIIETEQTQQSSDYLIGISPVEGEPDVNRMKAMRTYYDADDATFTVQSVLIDAQGNFLRGSSSDPASEWSAEMSCMESKIEFEIDKIREFNNNDPKGIDIGILLDNSACAASNAELINGIKDISHLLKSNDKIKLSGYNQDHFNVFGYSDPEETVWQLNNLSFPSQNGLNSPYKATYKEMSEFRNMPDKKRVLVLVAYNSDNSSIIYTPNDVVNIAKETNTAVYIIAMGNAVRTYSYKYISSMTGGRFYYLDNDNFFDFQNILSEIILSQKYYYEYTLPISNFKSKCPKAKATFSFANQISSDSDHQMMYFMPELQYSQYQAVATFDFQSFNISSSYLNTIRSLANVLTDNPEMKIELIGNSSNEGSPEYNLEISEKRAEAVETVLISYGIRPDQVKLRGLGSNKPVYYMETYDWQQEYNRRVEIRWLDPALLPYEIVAEFTKTETEAEEMTRKWQNLGYRSYYDRYIVENYIVYRVKIWGFSTTEEAEKEAAKLSKKYDGYFAVE